MKGRNKFTVNEADQIRCLLRQKIESGNEKSFRDMLRRLGFYISDFARRSQGLSPQDFDKLVEQGIITISSKPLRVNTPEVICLLPVAAINSSVLILGTIPGLKSRERKEYYANPNNHFWQIMECISGVSRDANYSKRFLGILKKGLALWDVLFSCKIQGSSDKSITDEKANDFEQFFTLYPNIKAICFNGKGAECYYKTLILPNLSKEARRKELIPLPSTSARSKLPIKEKQEAWEKKIRPFIGAI